MSIEFDPDKDQLNFEKHGLRLRDFEGFDAKPTVVEDRRRDYGERRLRAFGRIDGAGYCLAFVMRASDLRLVRLRRAREKEMRRYE
jgi:uncharacterized DUF497 family protein